MNAKAKGYVLGAIAAATYGMNPLFALPLYKAGMNPDSVLFFRYLFAIPVLGIMIKARGRNFKLKPNEIVPLILMGLLVSFSSLALFQSYNYMEAGIASTLLFVYPILVALIMAFVFKEKLTLQTIFCILLALGGIGLLYKSGDGTTLSLTGVLLVMASALSYAIYIVANGRFGKCVRWQSKSTFIMIGSALTIFIVNSQTIITDNHFGGSFMLWALFLAIIGTTIPTALFAAGIPKIGVGISSILMTIELPVAVICAVVVLNEHISPVQIAGIVVMLTAISIMNYYKSLKNKSN